VRILVTGGAGFIGRHTVRRLAANGHFVRVLDSLVPEVHEGSGDPVFLPRNVEFERGDVRDPAALARALNGISGVLHLAALTGVGQSMYQWDRYVDANVRGTATLLQAILETKAKVKRIVLASSRAVYGEGAFSCPAHGPVEPQPRHLEQLENGRFCPACPCCGTDLQAMPTSESKSPHPASVYAFTKLQQEQLVRHFGDAFGVQVVNLRYFNVYGSEQSLNNPYTGIVSIFFSRIRSGTPIRLYERGLPLRDFVHVQDVAHANELALVHPLPDSSTLNVGSGIAARIGEVAGYLGAACGQDVQLETTPEFRVGDVFACYADLESARSILGFSPRISLQEGLREFASWAATEKSSDRLAQAEAELREMGLQRVARA